ncbi:ClbS/DfsB family four-helix bundle protein [Alistipes sp. OttesenSCG-928-B03]|nr:ClbS/DfsB family four-helix bundle protein [Alistipes sp. OttesenSCG-928-B03]
MARPKTKEELQLAGEDGFSKLFALIDSLSTEEQELSFAFEDRDRNIRDVLVHLYEWHRLLIDWIDANCAGNRVGFLPEPYNWKTYPQMNIVFWEKHQGTLLSEAVTLLEQSHSDVMRLIGSFSNEELFTNKFFPWTGTTSLGAYCVSSTSSHYDWAMKKIKKHKRLIQATQ